MITANLLKKGKTFLLSGKPYQVTKYTHQKIARGGGTVKLSIRNLETGNSEEKTLSSSAKVEEIKTKKRLLQYLYNDGLNVIFMDPTSFEQHKIPIKTIDDQLIYIKEGSSVDILYWDDKLLSVDLPAKVTLKVKKAAPNIKGDSATNVYKSAILENGLELKVPLFIKEGDEISIDTRTGEYVERVKS